MKLAVVVAAALIVWVAYSAYKIIEAFAEVDSASSDWMDR